MQEEEEEKGFLNIRPFDAQAADPFRVYFFLASTGGKKTTSAYNIVYENRHRVYSGGMTCGSSESASRWAMCFPQGAVSRKLNLKKLGSIIEIQDKRANENIAKLKEIDPAYDGPGFEKARIIGYDDCNHLEELYKSPLLARLGQMGRHLGVMTIVIRQSLKGFEKSSRGNIGYCFLGKFDDLASHRLVFETFFSACGAIGIFERLYRRAIETGQMLVADMISTSPNIEDRIFFYRPSFDIGPYELGDRAWRKETIRRTKVVTAEEAKKEREDYEKQILKYLDTSSSSSKALKDVESVDISFIENERKRKADDEYTIVDIRGAKRRKYNH